MCKVRIVLRWVGAVAVLAASLFVGIAIANATVFSASAFVRDYLTTLAAGRVDEVMDLPGVEAAGLDERMLDSRAIDGFTWELVGDTEVRGVHHVTVEFSAHGARGRATLSVTQVGSRFAVFPRWGFATSPVTSVSVATTGDTRLTVGRLPLEVAEGGPVAFAALTPGVYTLSHESRFLAAGPVTIVADGAAASVDLAIEPRPAFVEAANDALAAELRACAEQHVLFPTGCPFGYAIENRVVSEPEWTITRMPTARLVSTDEVGLWAVRGSQGVARLRVEVQSLFDGSISTLEQDVPFSITARVAFEGDAVLLTALS